MSRRLTATAAGLLLVVSIAIAPAAGATSLARAAAASAPLTNLAHLDFLTTTVTPPQQAGHTTYLLGTEPSVGVLWVYANYLAPGSYQVTGGGTYDSVNNTYGQGAYDADDISRGRLPAALGAIRRPAQPRRGLPAAARANLPADRIRA